MNDEIKCVVFATKVTPKVTLSGCGGMDNSSAALCPPSRMTSDQAQHYRYESQNQSMMITTADWEYAGTFIPAHPTGIRPIHKAES